MQKYLSVKDHKYIYSKVMSSVANYDDNMNANISIIKNDPNTVASVFASAVGGTIISSKYNIFTCKCKNNHTFTTPYKHLYKWCLICNCMYNLVSFGVTNVTITYKHPQSYILVSCYYGHKFIADTSTSMCNVCVMLSRIRSINQCTFYDLDNIYVDKHSLLRFKCCKYSKYGAMHCCKDFISKRSMMEKSSCKIYNCEDSHRWTHKYGITNLIRLFELMYSCKFNDIIIENPKIYRPTGYNAKLKIAFIHMIDVGAENVDLLYKYCVQNAIILIIVPEKCTSSYSIIEFIVTKMHNIPIEAPWEKIISGANVENTIIKLRTVFKKNTQNGLLYPQLARIH